MHFNVHAIWLLKLFKITKGKTKIIGTGFVYGPIFRYFEFYDDLINWAKLRYYTFETYLSASFKDWKIWFFVYFQYKIWRNTIILFWKTEWGYATTFSSFIFIFLKISWVQWLRLCNFSIFCMFMFSVCLPYKLIVQALPHSPVKKNFLLTKLVSLL